MILRYVVIICAAGTILNTYAMHFTAKLRDLKHAKALSEQNVARLQTEISHTIEQSVKEIESRNQGFKDIIKEIFKLEAVDKIINAQDEYGHTLLMLAAEYGLLSLVKWCVENKADINLADHAGRTALMRAQSAKHPEVVACLQEHLKNDVRLTDDLSVDISTSYENDGFDGIEILSTRNSYSNSPHHLLSPLGDEIQNSEKNFQEKNDKQLDITK